MSSSAASLRTSRLLLRPWRDEDLPRFAALNADPRVMEFFPRPLSRVESDAFADRIRAHLDSHGWGLWAVQIRGGVSFAGYVGLTPVPAELPFAPAIEIGWRLAYDHWGRGYATEAARAVLAYASGPLGIPEVISYTAARNQRSRAVMQRIGMTCAEAEQFDHPKLPAGHVLRPHVLYRLSSVGGAPERAGSA